MYFYYCTHGCQLVIKENGDGGGVSNASDSVVIANIMYLRYVCIVIAIIICFIGEEGCQESKRQFIVVEVESSCC